MTLFQMVLALIFVPFFVTGVQLVADVMADRAKARRLRRFDDHVETAVEVTR